MSQLFARPGDTADNRFPSTGTIAIKSEWKLDRNRIARLYLADIEGTVSQILLRETSEDLLLKIEFEAWNLPPVIGPSWTGADFLNINSFKRLKSLVDSGLHIKMIDFDCVFADIHHLPVILEAADRIIEGGISTLDILMDGNLNLINSWIKPDYSR